MRRVLIVAIMVVFGLSGLFSQKTEIINGYKVHHGERPAIDLSKVTPEMYEPGKLLIKLAPGMEKSIKDDVLIVKTKDGYVKTGVQAIDAMNTKFQAEIYKPALYNFYKISPASEKFRARHIAWGINLWMEVTLAADADILEAVKEYSSLAEVDVAEPVYKKVMTSLDQPNPSGDTPKWTPNDPDYSDQWHYNNTGQTGGVADCDIDLPEAWEIEKGNSDVIVAIIDQGVEYTHPDIAANMWSGIGPDGTSTTVGEHGSHVAGTVAAVNNNGVGVSGVAGGSGSGDGVRIMTIDLFTPVAITTVLGMMTYAADNGASITQNSWGYGSAGNYVQGEMDGIDYFNANGGGSALNGGITIFAAGNDDDDGEWWPGFYSEALSVAATSYDDDRAYYSNYGDWVHIAAPGGDYYDGASSGQVYSTTDFASGSYMWMQGTSMACPHVSGVAALLVSNAYRNGVVLDPSDIWNLLVDNTDNIDAQNPTYIGLLGSGRMNAYSSLLALQDMLYTAPPASPSLVSPSNGSTIGDVTPSFDWSDNAETSSYTILVDNNSNFSSPEINEVTTESEYTVLVNLSEETYYWKVLATNNIGSSSYSTVWNTTISFPDINLSVSQLSPTAAPDASVGDSFDIENLGNYTLSYSDITEAYSGFQIPGGTYHANDFTTFPGTGYTNTSWVAYNGGARATGSGVTCTMTSPTFDTSASVNPLYLDMTQDFFPRSGNWSKVEYYTGSAWVEVYYGTLDDNTPIHLELPIKSTSTQLRFSAYTSRAQAATGSWDIDNIAVSSVAVPYNWLTVNSSTTGTVSVSGSNTINITCDATGLSAGTYNADITVSSDDPDEASKVLPVEFTVAEGTTPITPAVPGNILTSISGTDLVVDWDVAADATGYDVYSSDDPYGTFTFAASVGTNQYTVPADQAKLFYYVVATNATK
ncbi:MAG: S8 family serine peptidase [Candidatus Delongbacteria bacterium]|jgi:subtilisin family serine protease|nr:S8 family serine peptidase [Candidatus Delongbacteria bacterium]